MKILELGWRSIAQLFLALLGRCHCSQRWVDVEHRDWTVLVVRTSYSGRQGFINQEFQIRCESCCKTWWTGWYPELPRSRFDSAREEER